MSNLLDKGTVNGLYYEAHGDANAIPLFLGFPMQASMAAIFGAHGDSMKQAFLQQLGNRYLVIMVDYPSIGESDTISPDQFTPERACADMIKVANKLGIDTFIWWGYTVGSVIGLHLAWLSDRLRGLVIGGWPPIYAQYQVAVDAALEAKDNPPKDALVILRSTQQYVQWATFYQNALRYPEAEQMTKLNIPRLAFIGEHSDVTAGHTKKIKHASLLRQHQDEIEASGWNVEIIKGEGPEICMNAEKLVPIVRRYIDTW
jgi:pimeloyl-ACP methyl ester carboxylesterase